MQVMGPEQGKGYGTRLNGLAQILCRSGQHRMDRYHRDRGCRHEVRARPQPRPKRPDLVFRLLEASPVGQSV
jgi:hypothetical protein